MMKNKKTIQTLAAITILLSSLLAHSAVGFADDLRMNPAAESPAVLLLSDGKKTELQNAPMIENGTVYLPLRELIGRLDETADVTWMDGTVLVSLQGFSYRLAIDSQTVSVCPENESATPSQRDMYQNAVLKDDTTTYVPYRFFDLLAADCPVLPQLSYAVYDDEAVYAAAKTWAAALLARDGKPRYAMMTTERQAAFVESQKLVSGSDWNFVIGYSSPKTVSYCISALGNRAEITYLQIDQDGERYLVSETITFTYEDNKLLVSDNSECTFRADGKL